jgi:hypothetical protein
MMTTLEAIGCVAIFTAVWKLIIHLILGLVRK